MLAPLGLQFPSFALLPSPAQQDRRSHPAHLSHGISLALVHELLRSLFALRNLPSAGLVPGPQARTTIERVGKSQSCNGGYWNTTLPADGIVSGSQYF